MSQTEQRRGVRTDAERREGRQPRRKGGGRRGQEGRRRQGSEDPQSRIYNKLLLFLITFMRFSFRSDLSFIKLKNRTFFPLIG